MTTTADAPILLNGEPFAVTHRTLHLIEVGGWLYAVEEIESPDCDCRRCSLHEDFGGCIPAAAMWGLMLVMTGQGFRPEWWD